MRPPSPINPEILDALKPYGDLVLVALNEDSRYGVFKGSEIILGPRNINEVTGTEHVGRVYAVGLDVSTQVRIWDRVWFKSVDSVNGKMRELQHVDVKGKVYVFVPECLIWCAETPEKNDA